MSIFNFTLNVSNQMFRTAQTLCTWRKTNTWQISFVVFIWAFNHSHRMFCVDQFYLWHFFVFVLNWNSVLWNDEWMLLFAFCKVLNRKLFMQNHDIKSWLYNAFHTMHTYHNYSSLKYLLIFARSSRKREAKTIHFARFTS